MLSVSIWFICCSVALTNADVDLRMPGGQPEKDDTYLCTSKNISSSDEYITGFTPEADMTHAHHMLLYGCEKPGSKKKIWSCGEMGGGDGSPCEGSTSIIFAWAMEGKPLTLPKDTAFKVGKSSQIRSLVLQIHYKNVKSIGPKGDHSGLRLQTQSTPTSKIAGVYLFATDGTIPAHSRVFLDVACSFNGNAVLHPFAFRTHTHKLGKVVSGFKIDDNGKFEEIGRKNPQEPQLFYPVEHPGLTIKNGDRLAARCIMQNDKDKTVKIGSRNTDEMCNFYIMYWVDNAHASQTTSSSNNMCTSPGFPDYNWSMDFDSSTWPLASLQVPGESQILKEFVDMDRKMNNIQKQIFGDFEPNFMDEEPMSFGEEEDPFLY